MIIKICTKCKIEKNIEDFSSQTRYTCKSCQNIYNKEYYIKNTEKEKERTKKYSIEHKEEISEKNRIKRKSNSEFYKQKDVIDREKRKEYFKNYNIEYREKNKEYFKRKRKEWKYNKIDNDMIYNLYEKIRTIILKSINRFGYTKKSKTYQILGCTFEELKTHLESKFDTFMAWDNHGKYDGKIGTGWDIDHITPISSAKTEEELLKLCHYTNLQPLDSYINRNVKRNRMDWKQ